MVADTDVVVSYGDVVLRRRDALTLMDGEWLNDQVITFFLEYLKREAPGSGPKVEFLHASLVHLVACLPDQDQVDSVLSSLSLGEKEVVLAPINDSTDPSEPESGSHWSLLVYCRHDGRFCHYDSLGGSNDERAEAMAGKLGPSLGCSEGEGARVTRVKQMPRQANGCDCGLFAMAVAEGVMCVTEPWAFPSALESDSSQLLARVRTMRGDVLSLLARLQRKAEITTSMAFLDADF